MKQAILILSVLCAGLLFFAIYQAKQSYDAMQSLQHEKNEKNIYIKKSDSAEKKITILESDKSDLSEKITALEVDRGYTEIQLNKAEANINELIKKSNEYHIVKDTPKIVQNCDSIIESILQYFPVNDYSKLQCDSINKYYNDLIEKSDSIILQKDILIKNSNDLAAKYQVDKTELQGQNKQLKKNVWLMLGIGFAAGIITAFIK